MKKSELLKADMLAQVKILENLLMFLFYYYTTSCYNMCNELERSSYFFIFDTYLINKYY